MEREQVCECLRRLEKRLNSLLRLCHLIPYETAMYRLALLFSSMLQMSVDIAYVLCREIDPDRCDSFEEVLNILRSLGVIRKTSEAALRELNTMLTAISRMDGVSLSAFIRDNMDRAIELTLTYTHDMIRYLDEYCKPRFAARLSR